MTVYAFDVETSPIIPGLSTPQLVCLTYYTPDEGAKILDHHDALPWFWERLVAKDTLIAANISFDLRVMCHHLLQAGYTGVMERVFPLLRDGHFRCSHLRYKLISLGLKGFVPETNLAQYTKALLGVDIVGKSGYDAWRLRYNELYGVPLDAWPKAAVDYALMDAVYAYKAYEAMERKYSRRVQHIVRGLEVPAFYDEIQQVCADFCLGLMTQWGLQVDLPRVEALAARWEKEREALVPGLQARGILRSDRTQNKSTVMQLVLRAYRGNPPKTNPSTKFPNGQTKTDKQTIEEAPYPDAGLVELIRYNALTKNLSTYADPCLHAGRNGIPVTARYDVLKKTGRTSSKRPNIQNQNQNSGIRECFVPREGCVFVFADWNGQEDRSLSQIMEYLGFQSRTAAQYRANPQFDPHSEVGWRLLKESDGIDLGYDLFKAVINTKGILPLLEKLAPELPDNCPPLPTLFKRCKWARSMAKIVVFGAPGGMVARTLVDYAKGWGLTLTVDFCRKLLRLWKQADPARSQYLDDRKLQTSRGRKADWMHPNSGRVRAGCKYTEFCNTPFQGQTADGAKYALFLTTWSCYATNGPQSDLMFGARPNAFIHDEIGVESPEYMAQDVARGLKACMDEGMNLFHPDVPCVCEVDIMRRWSKMAASKTLEDGTLTIWDETP